MRYYFLFIDHLDLFMGWVFIRKAFTNAMTVQIPLGNGSKLNNFELKMCLRSIDKHLANVDQVLIVGELPDWIKGVEYIPFNETSTIPDYNIAQKTMQAFDVVDKVLHVHDDHFLMQDFDANDFPYFYFGTLEAYVKKRGMDKYGKRANNSLQYLKSQGLPTKFFDIHTPIIYNKEPFESAMDRVDLNKGYIIKSLYSNSLNIEGAEMKDNKTGNPPHIPVKIFSSASHLKASVTRYLSEKFPHKSKYEK